MADVVVEVDVSRLAHQRQAATAEQRGLDELQVPRRRDRLWFAHPLELPLEVIRGGVPRQGELEKAADVHRRVARLERQPGGVEWGNLPHLLSAASPCPRRAVCTTAQA
jgi:hypothetical protein